MSLVSEEQMKNIACLAEKISVVLMFSMASSVLASYERSLQQTSFAKRCNVTPE